MPKRFTALQQKFVTEYLLCLNATEAARRAGYKGSDPTLAQIGYENLRKHEIKREVDQRLAEHAMSANEVLARLTSQARGDIDDVVNKAGEPDLERARDLSKTHLIKKVKTKTVYDDKGGKTVYAEIEIHDPQKALVHLGKYHELFADRLKVEDWRSEAIKDITAGRISFEALADAFDYDLATELFKQAGVPISTGESTEE